MPDVTIASTSTDLTWQGATPPKIRVYAKDPFITAEGVPVTPGGASPFFREADCTLDGGRVIVPAVTLPSTEDSSKPDAQYAAVFHHESSLGAIAGYKFAAFSDGFRVPPSPTSTTWADIDANMGNPSGMITPGDRTIHDLTVTGGATVAEDLAVAGNVTALAFVGDGSNLTGVGLGTSTGHSAPGSVTLWADNDDDGGGIIDEKVGATLSRRVNNDGSQHFFAAVEFGEAPNLPDGGAAISDLDYRVAPWSATPPASPSEGDPWLSASLMNVSISQRAADRKIVLSPTLSWEGAGLAEMNVYRAGGLWHMIYRANDPGRAAWATASYLRGPWTKNAEPILGLNSLGNPVNGVSGSWQPSTYVENGVLYLYDTDNAVGDIRVHTGDPTNPTVLTSGGTVLTHTATRKYYNSSVIKDTVAGGYVMAVELWDTLLGPRSFQVAIATATAPSGPFAVQAILPLYPSRSVYAGADADATAGGPRIAIEGGRYVMLFHGSTGGGLLPTEIYRATSANRLSGWVLDPYPFIRRATALDYDQTGDPEIVSDGRGNVGIFWEGVDNISGGSHVYYAQASRGMTYFDGADWVRAPWDGVTTERRVLAQRIIGVTQPNFIDFENLQQDYDTLEVEVNARSTFTVEKQDLKLRINADPGANYDEQALRHVGDSGGGSAAVTTIENRGLTTFQHAGLMTGSTAPAGSFGYTRIKIPNYAHTDKRKTMLAETGVNHGTIAQSQVRQDAMGQWKSTAAVYKLTLFPGSGGNFATGTVVTIYGVR